MFSCPSGANVSSSLAPPPNVTTTTLRPRGAASADTGANPKSVAPAVARVTSRKKSRRLCEMACGVIMWIILMIISLGQFRDSSEACRLAAAPASMKMGRY
jgi:hypothetical protein